MRLLFLLIFTLYLTGLFIGCDDDKSTDASDIGDTVFTGTIDSIFPDSANLGDSLIVRITGDGTCFLQGSETGAFLVKDTFIIFGQGYDTLPKSSTIMDSWFIIPDSVDTGSYDVVIYDVKYEVPPAKKLIERIRCQDCFRIN